MAGAVAGGLTVRALAKTPDQAATTAVVLGCYFTLGQMINLKVSRASSLGEGGLRVGCDWAWRNRYRRGGQMASGAPIDWSHAYLSFFPRSPFLVRLFHTLPGMWFPGCLPFFLRTWQQPWARTRRWHPSPAAFPASRPLFTQPRLRGTFTGGSHFLGRLECCW